MKGWSIERAAEILEEHGARNLCIDAGGNIAARGNVRPGEPWRVGIRHPEAGSMSGITFTPVVNLNGANTSPLGNVISTIYAV